MKRLSCVQQTWWRVLRAPQWLIYPLSVHLGFTNPVSSISSVVKRRQRGILGYIVGLQLLSSPTSCSDPCPSVVFCKYFSF